MSYDIELTTTIEVNVRIKANYQGYEMATRDHPGCCEDVEDVAIEVLNLAELAESEEIREILLDHVHDSQMDDRLEMREERSFLRRVGEYAEHKHDMR